MPLFGELGVATGQSLVAEFRRKSPESREGQQGGNSPLFLHLLVTHSFVAIVSIIAATGTNNEAEGAICIFIGVSI